MVSAAGLPAIFHWFCDDIDDARYVANLGFEFSVNPAMKDPQIGSPEVLKWIPADLLHLESDGPFVKWQERDMTPRDCRAFIPDLADFRGESAGQLVERLEGNSARLLNHVNYQRTTIE